MNAKIKSVFFVLFVVGLFIAGTSLFAAGETITTFVGTGVADFSGDSGQATDAELFGPLFTIFGPDGNLYFPDNVNHRLRKIDMTTNIITSIAGSGTTGPGGGGFGGDGGLATDATLNFPQKIVFDSLGNIYFADNANNRVRRIDAITGIITTVAGTGVAGFSGDGGMAALAELFGPTSVLVEADGDILISDQRNHRIRRIDAVTGNISTIVGSGPTGPGPGSFGGDGGLATDALLYNPQDIIQEPDGDLLITDMSNNRIRRVDAVTGTITTIAGAGPSGEAGGGFAEDGGAAADAKLFFPTALVLDADGNILFSDQYNHRIRKIDAVTGIITTVVGSGPTGIGAGSFGGDGGDPTLALLNQPNGIAVDSMGRLFIADQVNHRIRVVGEPEPVVKEVGIDIWPFVKPNIVVPGSNMTVLVAVKTSEDFDFSTIDPTTVKFGPDGAPAQKRVIGLDVDRDGDRDVIFTFKMKQSGIECGDTEASLSGKTLIGESFQGTDSIVTLGCRRR